MSIFDKLSFKKKEEKKPAKEYSRGDMPPMREPSVPEFSHPESSAARLSPGLGPAPRSDALDAVNAKLDAIRAVLDNINARIARLEKMASEEGEEVPRWR